MEEIKVKIEAKPLSINRAWQGRRYATKEYKDWRKEIEYLMPKKKMIVGDVDIHIDFFLINDKRTDADNLAKPLFDSIVRKGYIEDDCHIRHLEITKHKSKKDYIEIKINKYVQKL